MSRLNRKIRAPLVIVLLFLTVAATTLGITLLNPKQMPNNSPTPNPSPTPANTPIVASPSPTPPSFSNASFDQPLSFFTMTSPTNTTYVSNTLTLNITGQVVRANDIELLMNYSIDGQATLPLPVSDQPRSPDDPYVGIISGTINLPKLSNGTDNLTVFGDLRVNDLDHLAQAKVYFTIDSNLDS